MIFSINDPEELMKFAESCESHRYRVYYDIQEQTYWLRPTKSSKHLDTVKYRYISVYIGIICFGRRVNATYLWNLANSIGF